MSIDSVRRITVIEVRYKHGSGKDETDPIRQVSQYYNDEGQLLAESDPAPWYEGAVRKLFP